LPGLFVTGTDTGVGKTVLAASIVASLRSRGLPVRAFKPVITGLDDLPDPDWPPDHELLARAAGRRADEVALVSFGAPVSPHLAAELAGREIEPAALLTSLKTAVEGGEPVIVEGVGGLLVPLADGYDVYVVTDASGGVSPEAHDMAIRRLVAAGAQPITWLGLAGELQRDWARTERLGEVAQLFIDHAGATGSVLLWETQLLGAPQVEGT